MGACLLPRAGRDQLLCPRVRKHPGTVQPLGTPGSLAQPWVPRPDPWGVLGVAGYGHVLESRSEPETVTVLWTSSKVVSPALCPAKPDLSVKSGPTTKANAHRAPAVFVFVR